MDEVDCSVIIATHNRAASLSATLDALSELDTTGIRWELIVVNNASSDDTETVLRDAADRLPLLAREHPVPGKNRALNCALEEAQGKLLVFTDDDVIPPVQWLKAYVSAARRWPDVRVFGGPVIPRFPEGTPSWLQDPGFLYASRAYARLELDQAEGLTDKLMFGPNLMIRASIFERFRYDESIGPSGQNYAQGGETELLLRLRRCGESFAYVPATRLQHVIRPSQLTLEWLFGRAYRYGRGSAWVDQEGSGGVWLDRLRLGRAWLSMKLKPARSDQDRFAAGHQYHFLRGRLAERKHMAGTRRSAG